MCVIFRKLVASEYETCASREEGATHPEESMYR